MRPKLSCIAKEIATYENEPKLQNKNRKPGSILEIEGVTASQAAVMISFKLEDFKEPGVMLLICSRNEQVTMCAIVHPGRQRRVALGIIEGKKSRNLID
ncbi:1-FEH [Artemisia annua]|uniref:1-FEH n=1 Tax=Artemisia annua TaxID=35608 RepID=A0A2U1P201_ARTAN|nr:1-FEH [Artemisia annua]